MALRREICERFIREPGYRFVELADPPRAKDASDTRPTGRPSPTGTPRRAERVGRRDRGRTDRDGVGAFLAWGDPSLYDSTLRILDIVAAQRRHRLRRHPRHHRDPGAHRPTSHPAQRRWRAGAHHHGTAGCARTGLSGSAVVMLDGDCSFLGCPPTTRIWWGAYLGTPDEILVAGTVGEVGERSPTPRRGPGAARLDHGHLPAASLRLRTWQRSRHGVRFCCSRAR